MNHEQIVACVCTRIATTINNLAIRYPGDVIDTKRVDEWATVDVPVFDRPPQRKSSKDQRHGEIRIGIYVKAGGNEYRILRLSSDFVTALRHAELVVRDYDVSGDPRVGAIRVKEPKRNWRTRRLADAARTRTRVLDLIFPACAQGD